MRKFLTKALLFIAGIIGIFVVILFFLVKKWDLHNFPVDNVSNSVCFNTKLDQASALQYYKKCTFLISGSSYSLNNISGQLIENRTRQVVYNISSWGEKPVQTLGFLKHHLVGEKVKSLLIAFNNDDFGTENFKIDYSSANLFLRGNLLVKLWVFVKTFNIKTIYADWNYRNKNAGVLNEYPSLKFDSTGSVLLHRNGFFISPIRWKSYYDTTAFAKFYKNIEQIHSVCTRKGIVLWLVYLPNRPDLVTPADSAQNATVAVKLKQTLGAHFINLNRVKLDSTNFCDGTHLFRKGALTVTSLILDSLNRNVSLELQQK